MQCNEVEKDTIVLMFRKEMKRNGIVEDSIPPHTSLFPCFYFPLNWG